MTNNQNIIIKKTTIDHFSYKEISALQSADILNIGDFSTIAKTISGYFKQNMFLADVNNENHCVYKSPNKKDHDYLKSNTHIAFSICIRDLAGGSINAKLKRLLDAEYLTDLLQKIANRFPEVTQFSHANEAVFVTDSCLKQFKQKELNIQKFFNKTNINQGIDLKKKAKNKANEVYSNSMQLAELASLRSLSYLFVTITPPPIFHIKAKNGQKTWDGKLTPNDNNDFLKNIWKAIRKRLHARKIEVSGHWSKEPFESMAIHLHSIIYCAEENIPAIKEIINNYTFDEYTKFDCGCDFVDDVSVNFNTGTCRNNQTNSSHTAISKYINKHIYQCLSTPNPNENSESKDKMKLGRGDKIRAHADKFNYRRFGFFGLDNALTLWKKVRQLYKSEIYKHPKVQALTTLFNMVADNNFKSFISSPIRNKIKLIKNCHKNNHFGESIHKLIGLEIDHINYYFTQKITI